MKALVTGATGFIGGHLAERLLGEGHQVTVLARSRSDTARLERLGARVERGELRDPDVTARAARGCDWLFHLAGTTAAGGRASRHPDWQVNVEGTEAVALGALGAGVSRLVFTSSVGVYGGVRKTPVSETSTPKPNSPYRRTKLAAEKRLLSLHRERGLPAVIARVTRVVGPRSVSWLPLLRKIASGSFRMVGSGENRIDVADVSDIVDGLLRCAESSHVEGKVYLLAGRAPTQLGPLVDRLVSELGSGTARLRLPALPYRVRYGLMGWSFRRLGVRWRRPHPHELFLADVAYDYSRTRREIGYAPRVHAEEALLRLVAWYRAEGLLPPGGTPYGTTGQPAGIDAIQVAG